jgi:hypothetical protein
MRGKTLRVAVVAAASLGASSGCGSASKHSAGTASQTSALGGPAPHQLVGTFRANLSRRDAVRAPRPAELPLGPWTLVIGNSGGPNNSRALGIGNGDTNKVLYRFGVRGNVLSVGCNDDQGLPAAGSQTYTWSIRGRRLTFKPASAGCQGGDRNTPVILSSHAWTRQGG